MEISGESIQWKWWLSAGDRRQPHVTRKSVQEGATALGTWSSVAWVPRGSVGRTVGFALADLVSDSCFASIPAA